MASIKNIHVNTDNPCHCDSWLKHWENHTGVRTQYCIKPMCIGHVLVGAHAQIANSTDERWYIVPLCIAHSKTKGELEISDAYPWVSADTNEPCPVKEDDAMQQ